MQRTAAFAVLPPDGCSTARVKCGNETYLAGICELLEEEPVPETDELLDVPASPVDGAEALLDAGAVTEDAPEESRPDEAFEDALLLGLFTEAPEE